MGIFSKVFGKLVGKKDCRILMVGLDAAGKMLVHALRWPGKVAVALGGVAIVALMGLNDGVNTL